MEIFLQCCTEIVQRTNERLRIYQSYWKWKTRFLIINYEIKTFFCNWNVDLLTNTTTVSIWIPNKTRHCASIRIVSLALIIFVRSDVKILRVFYNVVAKHFVDGFCRYLQICIMLTIASCNMQRLRFPVFFHELLYVHVIRRIQNVCKCLFSTCNAR